MFNVSKDVHPVLDTHDKVHSMYQPTHNERVVYYGGNQLHFETLTVGYVPTVFEWRGQEVVSLMNHPSLYDLLEEMKDFYNKCKGGYYSQDPYPDCEPEDMMGYIPE
jgi:hypothetical protein